MNGRRRIACCAGLNIRGPTMQKFLTAAACVGVGFGLGIAFLGTALKVGAVSVPTATQNGDTNGDGARDISDAVYLLQFLFSGGAEIAKIECPQSQTRSCLLATGQKDCYGSAGLVACDIEKARGQDAFHKLGCPPEGRFVDNGDGTISDACTGLMWTKKRVDVDGDGELTPQDAKPWLEACQIAEDMTYLGHDDWRVPNVNELLSIMDFSASPPGTGGHVYDVFESLQTSFVWGTWTSTHNGVGGILTHLGPSGGGACDCCVITRTSSSAHLLFMAVRGPVSQ
jgi:hypothetical protein